MSDAVPLPDPPGHRYRLLTGPDDAAFCSRVSDALAEGYQLYGSPAVTFDGERVVAAQAVLWPGPVAQVAEQLATAVTQVAEQSATVAGPAHTPTSPQNGDDR